MLRWLHALALLALPLPPSLDAASRSTIQRANNQKGYQLYDVIKRSPLVLEQQSARRTASVKDRRSLAGEDEFCFSSQATVQVFGRGKVEMQDLRIGDYVITGNPEKRYEVVYGFGHWRRNTEPVDLIRIQTFPHDKKRRQLEITGQHMVYLHGKPNPVRADSLQVGDILRGDHFTGLTVTKISQVKRKGLYAPLTPHGSLLVDGIVASAYISLQRDAREHIELGESGFTVRLSQKSIVHMFLSPYRMYCLGVGSGWCGHNYNDKGMPHYVAFGLAVADWGNGQHVLIQLAGLLLFLVLYTPFVLLEEIAGPEMGPMMLWLGLISFILYKRSSYRVRIKIRHSNRPQGGQATAATAS